MSGSGFSPLDQTITRLRRAIAYCEKRRAGYEETHPFREALAVLEDLRAVRDGAENKKRPLTTAIANGQEGHK